MDCTTDRVFEEVARIPLQGHCWSKVWTADGKRLLLLTDEGVTDVRLQDGAVTAHAWGARGPRAWRTIAFAASIHADRRLLVVGVQNTRVFARLAICTADLDTSSGTYEVTSHCLVDDWTLHLQATPEGLLMMDHSEVWHITDVHGRAVCTQSPPSEVPKDAILVPFEDTWAAFCVRNHLASWSAVYDGFAADGVYVAHTEATPLCRLAPHTVLLAIERAGATDLEIYDMKIRAVARTIHLQLQDGRPLILSRLTSAFIGAWLAYEGTLRVALTLSPGNFTLISAPVDGPKTFAHARLPALVFPDSAASLSLMSNAIAADAIHTHDPSSSAYGGTRMLTPQVVVLRLGLPQPPDIDDLFGDMKGARPPSTPGGE